MGLFDRRFEKLSPPWLRRNVGARFIKGTLGMFADMALECARLAAKLSFLKSPEQPDDALAFIGEERNLERYPVDTTATYRARLIDAWNAWEFAGSEQGLEDQLTLFGFPGSDVKSRADWPTKPCSVRSGTGQMADDWSVFWVVVPNSAHSFTPGETYGSGITYGDGTLYGLSGPPGSGDVVKSMCRMIRKWKSSHDRLCSVIFEGDPALYGNGHEFGDAGLTYGGAAGSVTITC